MNQNVRAVPAGKLDGFLYSPAYLWLLAALTVAANVLGLEFPVYTVFIGFGVYMSIWGRDYLPLMPIVILCYIAPSAANNPGANPESVYFIKNGGWYLYVLAGVFLVSVVYRLLWRRELRRFFAEPRKLLMGMLLLGASYLLSGIGHEKYADLWVRNLTFGAIQFVAVFLCYYFFTGTVQWDRARADYFCHAGIALGGALLGQLVCIYLSGSIIVDGQIHWEHLTTGWGIHNNIGALLAMMIPFPFYFAARGKWGFHFLGAAYFAGVCLTCSRASMLFGAAVYGICVLYTIFRSKKRWLLLGMYAGVGILGLTVLWQPITVLFQKLIIKGFDSSNRGTLFFEGIRQYLNYPLLGATFFPTDYPMIEWSTVRDFAKYFPPRWHNTLIQMAASCGTVGLLAYGFHRFQTVRLFLRRRSRELLFVGLSLAVLLGTSLLDCHFFNVGPTLFYSMALAFAEKIPEIDPDGHSIRA